MSLIPHDEMAAFARLPEEARADVRRKLAVMHRLTAISSGIQAAIAEQASLLGMEPKTLRKYWDKFRKSNDWNVLVNRRSFPHADKRSGLPECVITLWKKLCEQNQRKSKPAYRELIRMWQRGEPAGMKWPETDFSGAFPHPYGCTYRNLLRYRPDDFSLTAMRQGLGAAMAAHGPKVRTTRVGLWVGSHFLIDDVKRDLEVLLIGKGGQVATIQELGVLDLFSGDRFAVHRRPQYRREDGTKDSLKEREMRFLIASVFRNIGFSPRGTEIVSELGTAAVRKMLAQWLYENSGRKITVRGPGITGKEQAIAGYFGSGGGNPRHKPALESVHNLLQNEAGNLPAQTGHDRNPPEWLHGIEAITEQVLKWMRELPPERAALFAVPMLEYWQALSLLGEIDDRIAWRTDHELQGWLECNHTCVEYRRDILRDEWFGAEEFLALPPSDQALLAEAAKAHPAFRRVRKLAPREVLLKGIAEFQRLEDAQLALIFCDRNLGDDLRWRGRDGRLERRLTADGEFELQDSTTTMEPVFFGREIVTPEGGKLWLEERKDYSVAFNPFDQTALWVYDMSAGFIRTAPRNYRGSPIVLQSLQQQLGRRSHETAKLLAPLAERHADAAEMIRKMQAENEEVRTGKTPADRAERKRAAENAADITKFLPPHRDDPEPASRPLNPADFLPKF